MTYLSALSGGSWPVMSLASNNFPEINEMVASWHVDESPIGSSKNTAHRASTQTLLDQVMDKSKAEFNVSWGDYLGRAVSYEFVVSQAAPATDQ